MCIYVYDVCFVCNCAFYFTPYVGRLSAYNGVLKVKKETPSLSIFWNGLSSAPCESPHCNCALKVLNGWIYLAIHLYLKMHCATTRHAILNSIARSCKRAKFRVSAWKFVCEWLMQTMQTCDKKQCAPDQVAASHTPLPQPEPQLKHKCIHVHRYSSRL